MPLADEEIEGLQQLAERTTDEDQRVEFTCLLTGDRKSWCGVVKAVVAFANAYGGVIVFDCDDHGAPIYGPPGDVATLDSAKVLQKLRSFTGEKLDFTKRIVTHRGQSRCAWFIARGKDILVFPKDIVIKNPADPRNPEILIHEGTVYYRHSGESGPATTGDLRAAMDERVNQRFSERTATRYSSTVPTEAILAPVAGIATETADGSVTSSASFAGSVKVATSRPKDLKE
jgi:predicted HTH transcriptional regulator